MSTPAEGAAATPRRGRSKRAAAKVPFWKRELGSGKGDADDVVEHVPFVPTLPHVNLLPQSIANSIAVAKLRRNFVLLAVLILVGGGALWYLQGSHIADAESRLHQATANNAKLKQDVAALADVKQMYDQITRLQEVVSTTLASQPLGALVIERIAAASEKAGADITFSSLAANYTGIPVVGGAKNACPNPDPFGSEFTIGCLSFSATADNRTEVSDMLRLMEDDPLFVGPYVTSSSASDAASQGAAITFTGSAGISLEALKTKLTPEQITALSEPPKPKTTDQASPAAEGSGS